ncbi:DegT/DnrJ/EryC1/StrS family aminotransferase [Roseovarius aestuariivivens]|uniref:DegT/DnrJ/EryC1/StrS family aminotransferase n=1 Tax=Roseovarius aestuariivivens TaxID=1888910 RepID=UPI001080E1D9|nr:DegT/DnrJ/EryC1/StrS family aminotransferase [Roseovarius aestuariivivens]
MALGSDLHPVLYTPRIPVAKPHLPKTQAIVPYLRTLDRTRRYSNLGPVSQQLHRRLADILALETGGVALTASGTTALIGAILARAGRARAQRLALCPSYTFVATISAAQSCGYEPYLMDVDADTWTLDPSKVAAHPRLEEIGMVMVTAPYGRLPDLQLWSAFSRDTGLPVIIDAAASFDVLTRTGCAYEPDIPIALSFHATKAFGCGEGGAILCSDPEILVRAVRATNHGFLGTRQVIGDNINGKMSEYHACVAMAALDAWPARQTQYDQVTANYAEASQDHGVIGTLSVGGAFSNAYALYHATSPEAAMLLREKLLERKIDSRFWYGFGLHAESGFGPFEQDSLTVTDRLARSVLGLPFYCDLKARDVSEICTVLAAAEKLNLAAASRNGAPHRV